MNSSSGKRHANLFGGMLQQTSSAKALRQQEFYETFVADAKQIATNLLEILGHESSYDGEVVMTVLSADGNAGGGDTFESDVEILVGHHGSSLVKITLHVIRFMIENPLSDSPSVMTPPHICPRNGQYGSYITQATEWSVSVGGRESKRHSINVKNGFRIEKMLERYTALASITSDGSGDGDDR